MQNCAPNSQEIANQRKNYSFDSIFFEAKRNFSIAKLRLFTFHKCIKTQEYFSFLFNANSNAINICTLLQCASSALFNQNYLKFICKCWDRREESLNFIDWNSIEWNAFCSWMAPIRRCGTMQWRTGNEPEEEPF